MHAPASGRPTAHALDPYKLKKTAALLHELGLALPIGSVLTFVVMNTVVGSSTDARLIYNQRQFVSAISRTLTIPGVWMLVGSDGLTLLARRRRLFADKWPIAKFCLSALIVANTTFVIAPLASRVTAIAKLADAQAPLLESYASLKNLEDRYGTVNFLLLAVALLAGIYEP